MHLHISLYLAHKISWTIPPKIFINFRYLLHVGWTTFLPFLVFLGRFVHDLSRYVTLRLWPLPLEVTALVADTETSGLSLVGLVTLTFDLETGAHNCPWRGQPFPPILVFLGRYVLHLSASSCQTRHLTLRPWHLTLEVTALAADGVFVIRSCTKIEVRRPSRSEDIGHLLCEH